MNRQTNDAVCHSRGVGQVFWTGAVETAVCREGADERVKITATINIMVFQLIV